LDRLGHRVIYGAWAEFTGKCITWRRFAPPALVETRKSPFSPGAGRRR
jgi:hypothetical protein